MSKIRGYFSKLIDSDKSIVILGSDYKGSPEICYPPTILLASNYTIQKYDDCFKFDRSKTKFVVLDT